MSRVATASDSTPPHHWSTPPVPVSRQEPARGPLWVNACPIKAVPVIRNIVIGMGETPLEAFQLQSAQFLHAGFFNRIKLRPIGMGHDIGLLVVSGLPRIIVFRI